MRDDVVQEALAGEDATVLADRHPTITSRVTERSFSASPCITNSGVVRSGACRLVQARRGLVSAEGALGERREERCEFITCDQRRCLCAEFPCRFRT